ncbi:aspartate dehydrogenase [Sinisalibacter aestuarii]|uniref:L-aspartate dehydrogenase n=1 Tax=Sinisalibacter aestuarii TaxID=2949426 RepID=A0ABQ5LWN5_9RHOB|nr:aspartate dehydrogenase [Sinisalibacter aestuarii]GKY89386.1 putative L-aspartate dehydrogenase 2 [Sinisalibacter aestuarii]
MHLGLIGYGNIAATLMGFLAAPGAPAVTRVTLLVRPGRAEAARAALADHPAETSVVEEAAALVAAGPDLVVEAAGHSGVRDFVPACLEAGRDVVVVSVGALADDELHARLDAAARAGGARVILPAGAVGGIDLVSALSASGEVALTYRGTKPPAAWAGTPADEMLDLAGLCEPATFFTGSAREAAARFPKNANVAATLALAGPGLDATRVELVADPAAPGNLHGYELSSPAARLRVEIENLPSAGNAKTSVATIYSVLREIRNRIGPMVI